jgi:hypothetical protein
LLDEAFVRRCDGNVNLTILNPNIYRLAGYLNTASVHQAVVSLAELEDPLMTGWHPNAVSAFRMVGEMDNTVIVHEASMIPSFDFDVKCNINPLSGFQATLDSSQRTGKNKESSSKSRRAHHEIQRLIKESMPRIPLFAAYFGLLKMITTVVHFELGVEKSDAKLLPQTFFQVRITSILRFVPPVPTRRTRKVHIGYLFDAILRVLRESRSFAIWNCDFATVIRHELNQLGESLTTGIQQVYSTYHLQ